MKEAPPTPFEVRLEQLRAMAEPTRLRLVRLLERGELTVTELVTVTGLSQPGISRHLKLLGEAGLVARTQEGAWAFYRSTLPAQLKAATEQLSADLLRRDDDALSALREQSAAAASRYFAGRAEDWDAVRVAQGGGPEVERAVRALVEERAAREGGRLARLSDLGTGTGRMLVLLRELYAEGVGYDRSAEMLKVARASLHRAEVTHARVRRHDLLDLEEDAEADLVLLHHVLHFLRDPSAAIAAAARAAGRGDVLVVDLAPHDREALREDHAHRRLGFADEEIEGWAGAADLRLERIRTVPPARHDGMTAKLWLLSRARGSARSAARTEASREW